MGAGSRTATNPTLRASWGKGSREAACVERRSRAKMPWQCRAKPLKETKGLRRLRGLQFPLVCNGHDNDSFGRFCQSPRRQPPLHNDYVVLTVTNT